MSGTELPPPYYALKDEASLEAQTEEKATVMPIPDSHEEAAEIYNASFEDKDSRIGFIQKILTIKLLQALAVTIVLLIFAIPIWPYSIYRALVYEISTRIHLTLVSSLILAATVGLLHYCDRSRFVLPYNVMFLMAYPLAVGFFVSVVSFQWALNEVLVSWVHFNFVLFALLLNSIFALQTKIAFKTNIALFITGGILIVSYALTVPFIYDVNAFGTLYCSLMMFALTAYMLNDLQAMMSKTYRIQLSPSDFVKAALIMHIDYRYMVLKLYKKYFHGRNSVNTAENAA